jgi:hypothetical protein
MAGEILRVLNGAGAGTEIPLHGEFVVGRSEAGVANLRGDSEISRRHARFQPTGYGQVILEDLGSTNGTHVNGHRLAAPHILAPGDQITMGKTILRFEGGAAGQAPGPVAAATPVTAPMASPVTAPMDAPVPPPAPAAAPAPGPAPPAYGAPPPSRRRNPLIAATVGAAVVVAGAVIAVLLSSGSDESHPRPAIQTVPTQTAPTTQTETTPAETTPPATPSVRSVSGLEASLKSALRSSSGPSPRSISCPSNAPTSAGSKFVCGVGGNGLKGTVRVTLKDNRRKAYAFKAVIFGNGFKRTVTGTVS